MSKLYPKNYPYTDAFLFKLKSDLRQLNLKQRELATELGTSEGVVSHWLGPKKTRRPSGESVLHLQKWVENKKKGIL